jgi:hypothetical protein
MKIAIPALTIRIAKADRTIDSHTDAGSRLVMLIRSLAAGTCKGAAVRKKPLGCPAAEDAMRELVLVSRLRSHRLLEWLVVLRVPNVMGIPHLEAYTPERPFLADGYMALDVPLVIGSRLVLGVWSIETVRLDVASRVPMVQGTEQSPLLMGQ